MATILTKLLLSGDQGNGFVELSGDQSGGDELISPPTLIQVGKRMTGTVIGPARLTGRAGPRHIVS